MTKWELSCIQVPIHYDSDVSSMWKDKAKDTGITRWDTLQSYAAEGWELVSVTPLNTKGVGVNILLYTFKRPIIE